MKRGHCWVYMYEAAVREEVMINLNIIHSGIYTEPVTSELQYIRHWQYIYIYIYMVQIHEYP
jgi:hypothetical protein